MDSPDRKVDFLFLGLFLLCCVTCFGSQTLVGRDSLCCRPFPYYKKMFILHKSDPVRASLYAEAWLVKSKLTSDPSQQMEAYKAMSHLRQGLQAIQFGDSIVLASISTKGPALVGSAYLSRGIILHENQRHEKALDDYLKASVYIAQTDDDYLKQKVNYQIGFTKYYLGYYHEAIALLKQCVAYFKEENDRGYLNSLHAIGLCYNSINDFETCSQINATGINAAREFEIPEMVPYFLLSEGINNFSKKNYVSAIQLIREALPSFIQNHDTANVAFANFYLASSYWEQKRYEAALPYLLKVDESFTAHGYLRPDLLKIYVLLKDYYAMHHNEQKLVFYIDRLLKADSIAKKENTYLVGKIHKVYDVSELKREKREIESAKAMQKAGFIGLAGLLGSITVVLLYRQHTARKRFKHYETLIKNGNAEVTSRNKNPYLGSTIDLNPQVAANLRESIEKFERDKSYLEKDMTLPTMARLLGTNQKYITKAIAHYRGKKTIEYISDLKIDYIIEQLRTNRRYRNYTNKALGEEAGFGSTQIFTKTFKARTGMSPSMFIALIEKTAGTTSL